MNVLIIGSGGREHAIADAFARSPKVGQIFVSPGNGGISLYYDCPDLHSFEDIYTFCQTAQIGMVFIGNEQPIEEGLSDFLRSKDIGVVAPSQAAAKLETSKAFAKDLMQRNGIPSAKYQLCDSYIEASAFIERSQFPIVIKASGLAAGKGVLVAQSFAEADGFLREIMLDGKLGESGKQVVIEEYLKGWEVSLFVLTDGLAYQSMVFAQDHKQIWDGDKGPNTGGMGAFAPVQEAEMYRDLIHKSIVEPTLSAMRTMGIPYTGILYCGLMICDDGPKVIEFNCRFGDPETQAVLPLLKTDFYDLCEAICYEEVDNLQLEWDDRTAVCLVLAALGYPGSYDKGIPIKISGPLEGSLYFAGVRLDDDELKTNGGRVLNLVGYGKDIREAREVIYKDLHQIDFTGKTYRKDIGLRINKL